MDELDIAAPDLTVSGASESQAEITATPVMAAQTRTRTGCGCSGAAMSGGGEEGGKPNPSFIYALGHIRPQIPSLGVEKEIAQATKRAETADLTERQALHAVISEPQNAYLARQLCYVFTVQGLETYLIRPRDSSGYPLLVEALAAAPAATDLHLVIGVRGTVAPPEYCNGLMLPVVTFDQVFAFDSASLVKSLPKPSNLGEKQFRATATDVFERIIQMTDNAGATDEHRALNYLAVRYPKIYEMATEAHRAGVSLTAIDVRRSRLSEMRTILDVVFSYTDRKTDVIEKQFVRVDVTEEFPFLVTKLSPYYDR